MLSSAPSALYSLVKSLVFAFEVRLSVELVLHQLMIARIAIELPLGCLIVPQELCLGLKNMFLKANRTHLSLTLGYPFYLFFYFKNKIN